MAAPYIKRLQRELAEKVSEEEIHATGVKLLPPEGDDIRKLKGEIRGPPDTLYAGGTFEINIEILELYPHAPPKMTFESKVWHPNVSSVTGSICLDVLGSNWAATISLRSALLSIQSLLFSPEPDSPQDSVVGEQYVNNLEIYEKTAKFWAYYYAKAPIPVDADFTEKIELICEIGVDKDKAIALLSKYDWEVAKAAADITFR